MLLKAQRNLIKDIFCECQFASYSQDGLKASNTATLAGEKKMKHEILMEKILKDIDPPSPIKPHEKAISYSIPKRKVKPAKKSLIEQENTESKIQSNSSSRKTDWKEFRRFEGTGIN